MMYSLLLGLFFCHFLGDFSPLSTAWMLNAKRFGKPFLPILAHAAVHASLMGLCLCCTLGFADPYKLLYLIGFQLVTHFLIDVWKGRMNAWFPILQSPTNKWHWLIFGFDQYLHATVIVLMTAYAV